MEIYEMKLSSVPDKTMMGTGLAFIVFGYFLFPILFYIGVPIVIYGFLRTKFAAVQISFEKDGIRFTNFFRKNKFISYETGKIEIKSNNEKTRIRDKNISLSLLHLKDAYDISKTFEENQKEYKEKNNHMIIDEINKILNEWNPIGVPDILDNEYLSYAVEIEKLEANTVLLEEYLENLLINVIGTGYDPKNHNHKDDLGKVVNRILLILNDKNEIGTF